MTPCIHLLPLVRSADTHYTMMQYKQYAIYRNVSKGHYQKHQVTMWHCPKERSSFCANLAKKLRRYVR